MTYDPYRERQERQEDERRFKEFSPSWTADEARSALQRDGVVVSAKALQALPGGATVMLVTEKNQKFGPFLLTPFAVSQLVGMLHRTNPQYPSN
jgi:hypothetical protein